MKKHYLDNTKNDAFIMFGVVSSEKPHRFAWLLNNALHLNLKRQDDIPFVGKESQESNFPRFDYHDELNRLQYYLLGNKDESQCILPELKHVDYILLIKGAIEYFKPKKLITAGKKIESVQLITEINQHLLKSKHNLIIPD